MAQDWDLAGAPPQPPPVPRNGHSEALRSRTRPRPPPPPPPPPPPRRPNSDSLGASLPIPPQPLDYGTPLEPGPCGGMAGAMMWGNGERDEIVHFGWKRGMVLHRRYQLQEPLGDGTFGRVVLAHDRYCDRSVAVKVIRDVERYTNDAKIEADILKDVRKADPFGTSGCALMYETFMHERRFFCLIFEPLGQSLYDFLKGNAFRGFLMQDLQSFARQSMEALAFLHGRLRMTHTDLKPENILLHSREAPMAATFPRELDWLRRGGAPKGAGPVGEYMRPSNNRIKLIDFGNATYEDEHHASVINTREYRGPEVLLALGWGERSDLWSIGCIMMELYSGAQLFATHEDLEHMALMERIVGAFPQEMLAAASPGVQETCLVQDMRSPGQWRLPWPERAGSPAAEAHVRAQRPILEQVLPGHEALATFCKQLLALEPAKRPTAAEALQHEFFTSTFQD